VQEDGLAVLPQRYKDKSMADSTDQQELRNIDSGQKGTKSVLDHMRSNCKKCKHMPKVPGM
jgi:hypothetical protein